MKKLAFLLVLAIGLAGCTQEPYLSGEVGPVSTTSGTYFVPISPPNVQKAVFHALDAEQLNVLAEEIHLATDELYGMIHAGVQVSEMHQRVQGMLQEYAQHPLFYQLEQTAANLMLRRVLSEPDLVGRTAMISDYTTRLLRNEHADATVLAPALEAMQGFWSESRLQASAEQAISSAERRLERDGANLSSGCEDCDARVAPGTHQVTMASHTESMAHDVSRLTRLL